MVTAGWWVAIVQLVPASARPYIGGSQDNSILELILGYNGLGRLTGDETGSVGGGGGTGRWGETGWTRMFDSEIGGQVAWLLPAALILLAAGLFVTRRRFRTDRTRAALLLWGGWLLVTGLTFSFLLNGSTASSPVVALLQADADDYTWAAAAVGSNNASAYQLASGEPVMAIGGFNGTDPWPTLAQFEQYVAAGRIHYFIGGGTVGGTQTGGSAAAQEIAAWVAQHYTATTVGGVTVYNPTG